MKNIRDSVKTVRTFFGEVVTEIGRCTWPDRKELVESTLVVIVSVLLLSLYVGLCDRILIFVLRFLVGLVRPG